ncbi:hypothetical protein IFM89_024116, partial [Coptis chinensis]
GSERIKYTIQSQTQNIPDARTYLLTLKEIRIKFCICLMLFVCMRGLPDDLGVEAMMMDALEKVEKELKKPLLRLDKKGMALLTAEFDKINKKAATSPGSSTPDIPGNLRALLPRENGGSHGSSRTTMTNTEDDWDAVATAEELKALKGELASLRLGNGQSDKNGDDNRSINKAAATKVKGLLIKLEQLSCNSGISSRKRVKFLPSIKEKKRKVISYIFSSNRQEVSAALNRSIGGLEVGVETSEDRSKWGHVRKGTCYVL